MDFWILFTKLAGTNFTLPAAALLAVWLACADAWRLTIWWCVLFAVGILIVTASKVAYVGWGIGIAAIDFKGFSGHAMRAASIAPPIAYLLLQKLAFSQRRLGLLIGISFAIAICISRLVLGVHSASEVISGLLLGLAVAFIFIMLCEQRKVIAGQRRFLTIGLLALLPTLLMPPAPTSSWIVDVAIHVAGSDHAEKIKARMRGD